LHSIGYRPGNLHAPHHVAIHPVGARQVHVFFLPILEVKNTGVLQKASDDRAHPNVFGLTRKARGQHASTTHNQINLNALRAGAHQAANQLLVGKRIHLDHHAAGIALAGG